MIKLIFRVDYGNSIGSGHIMRCKNIAEFVKNENTEFICTENEKKIETGFKVNYIQKSDR